ncbi:MAG: nucleoside kinase [Salinivirgaceae bacterium]|jgi:uridine kinase|nr:nucleoside kinase [Salinivirgaceae bacterium]
MKVEIICKNTDERKQYNVGTQLQAIVKDQLPKPKFPILGAFVNNKLKELDYLVFKPKTVAFIDIIDPAGKRMYVRSISFVLILAAKRLFPFANLKIEHSISKGYYCEFENFGRKLEVDDVSAIYEEMLQIIIADLPFERKEMLTEEAVELFAKMGYDDKATLLKTRNQFYTSVYYLDGHPEYFYGFLVPSTAYLQVFALNKYYDGMLLQIPKQTDPNEVSEILLQPKLFSIFQEFKDWVDVIGMSHIGALNEAAINGEVADIIKVSEALQEKKVSHIADEIHQSNPHPKLILISGPSSSGKTTFSKRLAIQLRVLGYRTVTISLDNYFVDRDDTPLDENGEYDFENIKALDIEFFNQQLVELFAGKNIELPRFSFSEGKRFFNNDYLQIDEKTFVIVEGIHGLNPGLTPRIPNNEKYKIYVSALTALCMDTHNRIPTTDNRLIRRIVRDHQYRGYSAADTIKRWPSVIRGESRYIFPYQEEADSMFNSALLFELGVLKKYAEPILQEVYPNQPEFAEANRLLKFFRYITPIADDEIPPTSILREFLHGSSFKYH